MYSQLRLPQTCRQTMEISSHSCREYPILDVLWKKCTLRNQLLLILIYLHKWIVLCKTLPHWLAAECRVKYMDQDSLHRCGFPYLTWSVTTLRKKVEPKQLHPWSRFMVRNSAPPLALFWCHLNMIIKGKNGSTLQGGTVFLNGSRVEPFWLHFFSQCI